MSTQYWLSSIVCIGYLDAEQIEASTLSTQDKMFPGLGSTGT